MCLIAAAALCVVLVAAVARAGTPAECGARAAMPDDWPVSPPAQQGLDSELICATGPALAKRTDAAPHGVVVVRHQGNPIFLGSAEIRVFGERTRLLAHRDP